MIPTLCELWELSYSSLTTAISLEVSFAQAIVSSPNTCKDWSLAKDIKNPYASFKRSSFPELCYFNYSPFCLPNSKFILLHLQEDCWVLFGFCAPPPASLCCSLEIAPNVLKGNFVHISEALSLPNPHPLQIPSIFSFQNSFSSTQWNFLQHSPKKMP